MRRSFVRKRSIKKNIIKIIRQADVQNRRQTIGDRQQAVKKAGRSREPVGL